MDVRQALYHLGLITGQISTEDLLVNIFQGFVSGNNFDEWMKTLLNTTALLEMVTGLALICPWAGGVTGDFLAMECGRRCITLG